MGNLGRGVSDETCLGDSRVEDLLSFRTRNPRDESLGTGGVRGTVGLPRKVLGVDYHNEGRKFRRFPKGSESRFELEGARDSGTIPGTGGRGPRWSGVPS